MAFSFDNTLTWAAGGADQFRSVQHSSYQGTRAGQSGDVAVDLRGIECVEAGFLKSLLRIARSLNRESRRLVIQNPEPEVERLLVLAGFLHLSNAVVLEHKA